MIKNKKILIVDDENEIVEFLETYLKRLGVESIKATNGKTALELYNKESISCIFLDLNMFGVDGYDVLEEIIKQDPGAKVIIITALNNQEAKNKATTLGAIDFLNKPIDLGELKNKVNKYAY